MKNVLSLSAVPVTNINEVINRRFGDGKTRAL